MPRASMPYDQLNDNPIHPRLNNYYNNLLRTTARRKGLPPNVLARMLIIEGLDKLVGESTKAATA